VRECRRAQASEPGALTAVKEALKKRAVPRSRSTPALQRLANGDAFPRPPAAASEAGSSSNDTSMHSADDVLSARSSLALHQDLPISSSSRPGGDFQPASSGFSRPTAADRGTSGDALRWGAHHQESGEPEVRWGGEDSMGAEGRWPVRNVRVSFPEEQEPAPEEEEPVYHLDLRPFMDLAPPSVRQALDCHPLPPNHHSFGTVPCNVHRVLSSQS